MRRLEDLTDWLAELIGALGLSRPAVAGHSYGGWIALGAAALRRDALGAVTALAPTAGMAPFRLYMALMLRLAEHLPLRPPAATVLRAQAGPGWQADPDFVALMEAMTRHLRTEVPFPQRFDDALLDCGPCARGSRWARGALRSGAGRGASAGDPRRIR